MCKANLTIDEISIQMFFEVVAIGEADPYPTLELTWLKRDDCWNRDETLAPKGKHLAWTVYVDLADNDAEGFSSPGELYSIMCFPEGYF